MSDCCINCEAVFSDEDEIYAIENSDEFRKAYNAFFNVSADRKDRHICDNCAYESLDDFEKLGEVWQLNDDCTVTKKSDEVLKSEMIVTDIDLKRLIGEVVEEVKVDSETDGELLYIKIGGFILEIKDYHDGTIIRLKEE